MSLARELLSHLKYYGRHIGTCPAVSVYRDNEEADDEACECGLRDAVLAAEKALRG